ncbi:MAG: hypothetical protein AAGA34_11565 [Pseudomonadota bacterium]
MMSPRALLASFATMAAIASPAAACDLHGPGQMAGFHRYNPFAGALQQFPDASKTSESVAEAEALAAKKKDAEQARDARRRQQAIDRDEPRDEDRDSDARGNAQEGRSALS